VHFSIGTYYDFVDCDVVPMQACFLLLGHPWEFDNDAKHLGRRNKYKHMHKEQKITLLPMTLARDQSPTRVRELLVKLNKLMLKLKNGKQFN